ncbi:MAG: hypothetical protein ACLSCG_07220 [Phocaeicola dorei]
MTLFQSRGTGIPKEETVQPRYDKRIAYPALNIPSFEKCQFSTLGRSANVYVIYKGNIPATAVQLPLLFV